MIRNLKLFPQTIELSQLCTIFTVMTHSQVYSIRVAWPLLCLVPSLVTSLPQEKGSCTFSPDCRQCRGECVCNQGRCVLLSSHNNNNTG